jgi:hypothetical protein
VEGYAELAAPLMDLLKVDRKAGKKGSKEAVVFGPKEREAFTAIRDRLLSGLVSTMSALTGPSSYGWMQVAGP